MDLLKDHRRGFSVAAQVLLACVVYSFSVVLGQEGIDNPSPAPPPLKCISRDERSQLDAAHDAKARTRATIGLLENRLHSAEEATTAKLFDSAAGNLGAYRAVIEDALHFLRHVGSGGPKIRDLYKKVELKLREDIPRLESIRRATPLEYSVHVKAIAGFVRDARTDALNSFFGDTVVRGEPVREDDKSLEAQHSKESANTPKSEANKP